MKNENGNNQIFLKIWNWRITRKQIKDIFLYGVIVGIGVLVGLIAIII